MMIGGRRSGRPWPENIPKGYRKRRGDRRNTWRWNYEALWFHHYESWSS